MSDNLAPGNHILEDMLRPLENAPIPILDECHPEVQYMIERTQREQVRILWLKQIWPGDLHTEFTI